jgi:gluconolactonase
MAGYQWAEGPVWIGGSDGYLLASDPPQNVIHRWSPKSPVARVWLRPSGYQGPPTPRLREAGANGLFLGRGGLLIADSGNRCITQSRPGHQGKNGYRRQASRASGLTAPTICVCHRPMVSIYFTDPAYGLTDTEKSPDRELDFTGVFRIAPDNSASA